MAAYKSHICLFKSPEEDLFYFWVTVQYVLV